MKISKKFRDYCFRLSGFVLVATLQCYAYAGFAVNNNAEDKPASLYENGTTLVPKSVSKDQALEFYAQNKDKYTLVFAYDLSMGQDQSLENAPDDAAFCINPYTMKIGIAKKAKDAMALTQNRPQVFYAIAGESLSLTLMRWAQEQGYVVQWNSPNDFKILFSHAFYGSFQQSLDDLLRSIASSSDGFAVKAIIMKNGVVVIKPNEYQAQPVTGVF